MASSEEGTPAGGRSSKVGGVGGDGRRGDAQARFTAAQKLHTVVQESLLRAGEGQVERQRKASARDPLTLVVHPVGKLASLSRASNGSAALYAPVRPEAVGEAGADWRENCAQQVEDARGGGAGGAGGTGGTGGTGGVIDTVTVYDKKDGEGGVVRALERERDEGRYIKLRVEKLYTDLHAGLAEIAAAERRLRDGYGEDEERGETMTMMTGIGMDNYGTYGDTTMQQSQPDDGSVPNRYGDARLGLGAVGSMGMPANEYDAYRQNKGDLYRASTGRRGAGS